MDVSSSPVSLYSPISDTEYPYTPSTTSGVGLDAMDVTPTSVLEAHSGYSSQAFDGVSSWPDDTSQWSYPKHTSDAMSGYSEYPDAPSYWDQSAQSGIYVYQDGAYHVVHPPPLQAVDRVSDYYQYHNQQPLGSSPLSPSSTDPSLWQASQPVQTPSSLCAAHCPVTISSNSGPIPLHQPRPTRRFNYQMMNDIAASLEASLSSGHQQVRGH